MIRKIADTSRLILDPTLDTYYLMDTSVLRLPQVIIFAGRAADLSSLGGKAAGADVAARAQSEAQVSVARYQVSLESDEVAAGLRKALDVTTSGTLGPNITNQLDTFRASVDAFVPPVNLLQSLDRVDTATVTAHAERARKLAVAVLDELDKLLQARADSQSVTRSQGVGLGLICLVLIFLLVWALAARPAAGQPVGHLGAASDAGPGRPDSRPGSGTAGYPVNDGFGGRDAQAAAELVHVGRGTRTRRRERTDEAR
jgi:hypothetical protein